MKLSAHWGYALSLHTWRLIETSICISTEKLIVGICNRGNETRTRMVEQAHACCRLD